MSDRRLTRVRTLALHEIRAATRSRILITLFAILAVATLASVQIGAADYRSQVADYEAYRSAATAAGIQQVAPLPLALLSLLRGAFEYLEIIGAVIAITLGYLSVTRERVGRTTMLVRSRPVTAGDLALGNALGAAAVIAGLVAATAAVAIIALGLIGGAWPTGVQLVKILLAYTAAVVYLMVFYIVGVIATTRSRVAANGLMVALGIWLVVVLILPQIGDTLDADNQIPGGLFASLGFGHDGEVTILAKFATYERIRTIIEAASFEKHFERFAFAMIDVKARYRDLSIPQLLWETHSNIAWIAVYSIALGAWLRRVLRLQTPVPEGGPS